MLAKQPVIRATEEESYGTLDRMAIGLRRMTMGVIHMLTIIPFYYSYHAFFSVAALLLKSLPVVRRTGGYWEDHADPWGEWFSRHLLTRIDGRWLADRRDPTPLTRRDWVNDRDREHWLWSVRPGDFFDCISKQTSLPDSLCVAGSWLDYDNYSVETIRVNSALVNREAAKSLAATIRTREHSYSCRLPRFKDSDGELTQPPFELLGWIVDHDSGDTRLDAFDPHAREIRYPPLEIGNSFVTLLGLTPDLEKFRWYQDGEREPVLRSETWSEEKKMEKRGKRGGISSWRSTVRLDQTLEATMYDHREGFDHRSSDLSGRRTRFT